MQRWETLNNLDPEDAEAEETVARVTAPTIAIPPMWQNPSLTPAPVTVSPE